MARRTGPSYVPTMTFNTFIRAPFSAATWRWTTYALVAFPLAMVWFTLIVTGLSTGIGLLFAVLTGIPVLWATLWLCERASRVERAWARTALDIDIPVAPRKPPASDRWYAPMLARITDVQSWREAAALMLSSLTGSVSFAVALSVWSVAFAAITAPLWVAIAGDDTDFFWRDWRFDTLIAWVGLPVAGVIVAFLAPWAVRGVAGLHVGLLKALLGPSRGSLVAETERLSVSREKSVDAAAAERRRIERDLHDGAQARLVALAMDLGRAKERLATGADAGEVATLVGEAHEEAKRALVELRDLARGIHPAVLTDRGLDPAISGLAARCPVPVTVEVDVAERPPASVEAVAYFVVAEALANVAKHSGAKRASVMARRSGEKLVVEIRDDGRGGASPDGNGLTGLADRVQSVDGTLTITSPSGGPTTILAVLPCG